MATASTLRHSAVMAVGTTVSKLTGYVRNILLAAALGNLIHADIFSVGNTIPNMFLFLIGGGAINAVFVPQLIRSIRNDPDGGAAYTNRIVSLGALFFGAATILLIVFARPVMGLLVDPGWPHQAFDATVFFARLCLAQVFFYVMFMLVGEILNARGSFGPMMWAPLTNNIISIVTLIAYLVLYGTDDPTSTTYGSGRTLLLGLGFTVGIASQCVVLVPFLRAVGVKLRPRFDFRHSGIGHTLRLGMWTILYAVLTQISSAVIVRMASTGTASGSHNGTGFSVYSSAALISFVPHSIVTVSLTTAILPQLSRYAAENDNRSIATTVASTLRTALTVVIPFAVLLPLVATYMSTVIWGYGSASGTVSNYVIVLACWGPGLVSYTVSSVLSRGFFAREENRVMFLIQCLVTVVNVVAAVVFVGHTSARWTGTALTAATFLAYATGAVCVYVALHRRLGWLDSRTTVSFVARLLVCTAVAASAGYGILVLLQSLVPHPDTVVSFAFGLVLTLAFCGILLALASSLRIKEITDLVGILRRRLARA